MVLVVVPAVEELFVEVVPAAVGVVLASAVGVLASAVEAVLAAAVNVGQTADRRQAGSGMRRAEHQRAK